MGSVHYSAGAAYSSVCYHGNGTSWAVNYRGWKANALPVLLALLRSRSIVSQR